MNKAIVALAIIGLLGGLVAMPVFAQEKSLLTASVEELGLQDPGLLPTNPFYFLKSIRRNIRRSFTFNPIKKVQLELAIADETAAEVKRLEEIRPDDTQAIEGALENYQEQRERLQAQFEKLEGTAKNPEIDALVTLLSEQVEKHEKVLEAVEVRFSEHEQVVELVDSAVQDIKLLIIKEDPADSDSAPAAFGIGGKGEPTRQCLELEKQLYELKTSVREGEVSIAEYAKKGETLQKELIACRPAIEPLPPIHVDPVEKPTPIACPAVFLPECDNDRTSSQCVASVKKLIVQYPRCGFEVLMEKPTPEPAPIVCTKEHAPVCGINGKTYGNACTARANGVEVKYAGECGREQIACTLEYAPVCGTNNRTYSNTCHAKADGVGVQYSGECKNAVPPPSSCGQIQCFRYDPVCGTNGVTYSCGEADALSCGVKVEYVGECKVAGGGSGSAPSAPGEIGY